MNAYQFCTPGWLKESARIYKAKPDAKDKLKKLTAKICYRVKSDPDWCIREDIIFCSFFEKGELRALNFFTEDEAFQASRISDGGNTADMEKDIKKKARFCHGFHSG